MNLTLSLGLVMLFWQPPAADRPRTPPPPPAEFEYQTTDGRTFSSLKNSPKQAELERDLEQARAAWEATPDKIETWIWLGRRQGYLWRMNEAVNTYTQALERWPDNAALYRHRGHRYISLREFDRAVRDLERAAKLMENKPDEPETSGSQPEGAAAVPGTLKQNIYYHLGVAHFLRGAYEDALAAFRKCYEFAPNHPDNITGAVDWIYMCLCRLGREAEAAEWLAKVDPAWTMIESGGYHRRVMVYKGVNPPESLLNREGRSDTDAATELFGLANWHLCHGRQAEATALFKKIVELPAWPAFGFIGAEMELKRAQLKRDLRSR